MCVLRPASVVRSVNVYSSVKQVTDFFFSEQTIGFNRVVAIQYPRPGIWAIAFVTGEGMLDVCAATKWFQNRILPSPSATAEIVPEVALSQNAVAGDARDVRLGESVAGGRHGIRRLRTGGTRLRSRRTAGHPAGRA
jgi:hypothetical protein